MDRIEFAERRYQQIVPVPVRAWKDVPVETLRVWLQDDVAPLVSTYAARPKFREAAEWPLRVFRVGSGTCERNQVDAVSATLVRRATNLLVALRSPRIATVVRKALKPSLVVDEDVEVGGAGVRRTSRTVREVDPFPALMDQLKRIAQPFWRDLVDPADYFEPLGAWLEREETTGHVTAGEFVVALNPTLHAVGDFVTRCLLRRVGVLAGTLEEADRAVLSCVPRLNNAIPKCLSKVGEEAQAFRQAVRSLNEICQPEGEAAVRDSCIILAQVYAAFHPAPDVGWLGLPAQVVEHGRVTLRHRFANTRNPELTERVATALGDLRRLYSGDPPGQSAVEEAIARGGLVLTISPQAAYWARAAIPANWTKNRRSWELLYALARKGRLGAAVEEQDMYPDGSEDSAMPNLWLRLKGLLPAKLRNHVVPGLQRRSYRLTLDPTQIVVI